MADATESKTKKTSKPFVGLRCPHCGDGDCLSVKVETLDLTCDSCSEVVKRADVETQMVTWARLLAWIDLATTTLDRSE